MDPVKVHLPNVSNYTIDHGDKVEQYKINKDSTITVRFNDGRIFIFYLSNYKTDGIVEAHVK